MRTNLFLAGIIIAGFLAAGAGMALAQGQTDGPDTTERQARMAALREARNESLRSFHENRSLAVEEYRAAHNATRASFLENKTRIIDACESARNATADDSDSAFAKCVTDGLKPLIGAARAAHEAQKDAVKLKLLAARDSAKAAFVAARAAHGPRSSSG